MNEEIRLFRWFDSLSFMRYVRMRVYAARSDSVRSHQNWGVAEGRANMNSIGTENETSHYRIDSEASLVND